MLKGFTLILVFQLAGEALVYILNLPIPGPVMGLLLLWLSLVKGWLSLESVEETANLLLNNLVLLFVPIVVGAMVYADILIEYWLALGLGIIVSTLAGMLATGMIATHWKRKGTDA
ncbi:CidA/LrgA family protein [Metallumcola ferriviriculae]|uniref:CidA/LrgA family protein n=1 Tax=Metallumcola ferriviriculae TaxID=3039180 RepID=A0AAU0UJJ0_9FIRM|nr:CidA/LrgA family protein [Desulfitibacteraceae bacterium MK1]